jgi:ABC-2 type transport system ATP-binding protein
VIRAEGLSKSFGETRAVADLDLAVSRGELLGIVGPDGSGKSTLLRMLALILRPDSGAVFFNGTEAFRDIYAVKERIAYMPQRFGLYEDLTVEENIHFFGSLFGMTSGKVRMKLPELYRFRSLEPVSGRLAGKLSGGMKQKLGLACCLVHESGAQYPGRGPPTASIRFRAGSSGRFSYDLLGSGVTIIVSTAYLDEAERCGRLALMHKGAFMRTGSPAEVKSMPGKSLMQITSEDPAGAEALLRKSERYSRIIRTGPALRFFSGDEHGDRNAIMKILKSGGLRSPSIEKVRPSLEDVFVEIMSAGGGGEVG